MMKYSIIIPSIGRGSLSKVIRGIYDADGFDSFDIEILVVFDGEICDVSNSLKRNELQLFSTGKKIFSGGARNLGIKKSTGDVLIFIGDNGIPDKRWLLETVAFHEKFIEKNKVLLGMTLWENKTEFINFLENGVQFDFKKISKLGANWKNFYTSNISLKRELLFNSTLSVSSPKIERANFILFSDKFSGWGFEDSELGYRLEEHGMELVFNKNVRIFRTDNPTIEEVVAKIKSARLNAKVFESIHPEVKILPRGIKKIILYILIFFAGIFAPFSRKLKWWYLWKKNWIS